MAIRQDGMMLLDWKSREWGILSTMPIDDTLNMKDAARTSTIFSILHLLLHYFDYLNT
jgi:hypothetical protein